MIKQQASGFTLIRKLKVGFSAAQNSLLLEKLMTGIDTGVSVPSKRENITFQNSLQVLTVERFVFSCDDEFDLVVRMLSEHPELRKGPRVALN